MFAVLARVAAVFVAITGTPLLGGDITLSLPANPSTGYQWVLDEAASTGLDLVRLEDRGHGPPVSGQIGAPAEKLFAAVCRAPGPVRLVFDYVSPDGTTVGETRSITLTCD
jgi:predicted secreted protein